MKNLFRCLVFFKSSSFQARASSHPPVPDPPECQRDSCLCCTLHVWCHTQVVGDLATRGSLGAGEREREHCSSTLCARVHVLVAGTVTRGIAETLCPVSAPLPPRNAPCQRERESARARERESAREREREREREEKLSMTGAGGDLIRK